MSISVLIRSKGQGRALTLYYVDPDTGREVTKSAETKDKGEAERAASRWEEQLILFRGKDGSGWDYARRRFEDEHLAFKRKSTKKSYGTALNAFRRLTKLDRASQITSGTISQFQAALLAEDYPVTTIANYLTHVRGFLNWLEFVGVIPKAAGVKLPSTGKNKLMKGRPLTESERKKMLRACSIHGKEAWQYQRLLELLWYSGLRIGEALQLSWERLPVKVMLDASPYPCIIFAAAGQKSDEDEASPVPPDFAAWLQQTKPARRKGPVVTIYSKDNQYAVGKNLLTPKNVSAEISRIGKAAGVVVDDDGKFASAHDYRRSYGTRWAMKVRPVTLKKMMRHKSIETTLKFYVTINAEDAGSELWAGQVSRKVSRNQGQKRRKAE